MSNTTIHVNNVSSQTSEKELREFFSFCGKISSLSVTPASDEAGSAQSATVTFEKEGAARTALLFDNTQLGPNNVKVTSAGNLQDIVPSQTSAAGDAAPKDVDDIAQEDKPRSRIIAEYLAHGYVLSDGAIQRAIELDSKHGLSTRFTSALSNFDNRVKASERARSVDTSYGVTDKANASWRGLNSYFEKALGTPTGQRVVGFYTQGEKQVRDIHQEARRLADLRKSEQSEGDVQREPGTGAITHCNCGADLGKCPCEPGKCTCSSCPKNASSTDAPKAEASGAVPAPPTQ
ncbi:MAG: Ubiquitin-conjugating enzyme E2 6 [Chaenotheca gracillima]|nr:MAG: Ubiquitin-conjugating enzyme E2 6 [Chaenotheca gracillima]